jgi:hypothetical protein
MPSDGALGLAKKLKGLERLDAEKVLIDRKFTIAEASELVAPHIGVITQTVTSDTKEIAKSIDDYIFNNMNRL